MEPNWIRGLFNKYPLSFLGMMIIVYFNFGLLVCRMYALLDLYKAYYHMEPSLGQKYIVLIEMPILLRPIYGLIVDSKLINFRKWYIFWFSFYQTCSYLFITFVHDISAMTTTIIFIGISVALVFVDVTMESMVLQQARIDEK